MSERVYKAFKSHRIYTERDLEPNPIGERDVGRRSSESKPALTWEYTRGNTKERKFQTFRNMGTLINFLRRTSQTLKDRIVIEIPDDIQIYSSVERRDVYLLDFLKEGISRLEVFANDQENVRLIKSSPGEQEQNNYDL